MIEPIMYFGIGFLCATLIGVILIPSVHARAVRLTIRRLEDSIPQSMAEIQADKDALRAEFAMSTRRLEVSVDQLQNKSANQLAELGRKGDAINRLKMEREAQKVEVIALRTEVNSLNEALTAARKEVEAAEILRREHDDISLVPRAWPTAEPIKVAADFQQVPPREEGRHEGGDLVSVPSEPPIVEETPSDKTAPDPHSENDSYDQRMLQVVETSIRVLPRVPDYQPISDKPPIGRRISRDLAQLSIAALIGAGAVFALVSQNDEAREIVRLWASSLNWLQPASTKLASIVTTEQADAIPAGQLSVQDATAAQSAPVTQSPAAPATASLPESPDQSEKTVEADLASRNVVEPATAKPEEAIQNIATLRAVEKDVSSPAPQTSPAVQTSDKLTRTPAAKPTAIADWMLREVVDGTAVLQGPDGILRVTRGDTVPGLGKVDSIVRWGNRWIVATSIGYCKSDLPDHTAEDAICKPYRGQ